MIVSSAESQAGLSVTNTDFLAELAQAAPDGSCLWVNRFHGNPNSEDAKWHGMVYTPSDHTRGLCDGWSDYNTYFSVAAVKQDPDDGLFKRRKSTFARMLALVVDDVDLESLYSQPSWVLETSPGKTQAGYLLDAEDPDCANEELCSAVVKSMTMRGFIGGDISGNNAVRYVRLPVGTNQKPRTTGHFRHKLLAWRPNVRLTLEDACGAVGMDLDSVRNASAQALQVSNSPTLLGGSQDEKLQAAVAAVMQGHFHEPLNIIAASMISTGAHPAAVTNMLRGLMMAYPGQHDDRWEMRFKDIPRCVRGAEEKFKPAAKPTAKEMADQETGEIIMPGDPEPLFELVGPGLDVIKDVDWTIDRYIEHDAVSMVFGPSGVGKSFVVLGMACCVATGRPWFGMTVKQGPVFYIAGEGHNGLMRRFKAWEVGEGVSLRDAPLYKSRKAIGLLNEDEANRLREELGNMVQAFGAPSLIVVDTLARNFGNGDENSTEDMSKFVRVLDEIRAQTRCHIMVVHHSGHEGTRARGSSSLRAAMDQEYQVDSIGPGTVLLKNTKMKDAEPPGERHFRLKQIQIGVDGDGVPVNGAYLSSDGDPLDFVVGKTQQGQDIKARQVVAVVRDGWPGLEVLAIQLNCARTTAKRIVDRCVSDYKLLVKDGRGFVVAPAVLEDPITFILGEAEKVASGGS